MSSTFTITALLLSLVAFASAHGFVQGIVVDGTYYTGYHPSFQWKDPAPLVIGWSIPKDVSIGYIAPDAFANPDIICHLDATPANVSAKVTAGNAVELQWTTWPDSHHGPVLDYLAKCPGDCADVDKTTLEFFKISEGGLVDGSSSPGTWASDQLISNNNSWVVNIPKGIAPGNYVLRHEIIALHSADKSDGAQNYPQCINLEIASDGSDTPVGKLGTALYQEDDPGIAVDIWTKLSTYVIPGPTIYSGAVSIAQTEMEIANYASQSFGSSTSWVKVTSTSTTSTSSSHASSPPTPGPASMSSSVAAVTRSSLRSMTTADPPTVNTAVSSSWSCTKTAHYSSTATSSSSPSSGSDSVSAPPYPAIASLASAAPSGALTSTIPEIAPTASAYDSMPEGNGTYTWGDKPNKPLPEGYTLKDLLEWVAYSMKTAWKENVQGEVHQRDFRSASVKF